MFNRVLVTLSVKLIKSTGVKVTLECCTVLKKIQVDILHASLEIKGLYVCTRARAAESNML